MSAGAIIRPDDELGILKTSSRSVLGSMNDYLRSIRWHVELDGGLAQCDVMDINNRLNSTPMGALDYAHPRDVLAEILIEHGPNLGL